MINNNVNNSTPIWGRNIHDQECEQSLQQARGDSDPLLAFLETGSMLDNNIAITGNYDRGNYRINYGNMKHSAVVPSNKTTRNNLSFDALYKVTDNVSISSQASY